MFEIEDIRNGNIIREFPAYGKHSFDGFHYGFIVLTNEFRVLYFFVDYSWNSEEGCPTISQEDVSEYFEIRKRK